MIEMCALEGKNLACINGDTFDTSKKLYEQWNEHVWLLYDSFSIHGGVWDNLLCIHNNSDVCSSASLHMDFHTLERLKMIWSRIKEFHVWWESLKNVQFGMGRDELPIWWYDFHNLIFLLYNDKILLFLLISGRRHIKPWDPGILRNDRVQKVAEKFGSLQRRQWDPGILLSYFNWVGNFAKGSGIKEMTMIRVVQQQHGGQICSTL